VLIGAIMTMNTAAGRLALGVLSRRVLFLGLGAMGVIRVVPHAVSRYLAGPVALITPLTRRAGQGGMRCRDLSRR
jgi:hypothetical protein